MKTINDKGRKENTDLQKAYLPSVIKEIVESNGLKKIKRQDLANATIESIVEAVSLIPRVGGFLSSSLRLINSQREAYLEFDFFRKFLALIYGIRDLQPKDISLFMDEIEAKSKDLSGNVIINLINKTDNINKITFLTNLIKSRISENISINDFFRLSSMLERIPYTDLDELKKYETAYYDDSGDTELLFATGVLKLDTIDANNENLYILSELGRKLLTYGMLHSAIVDNRGGTTVSGMLTGTEVCDTDDIFINH